MKQLYVKLVGMKTNILFLVWKQKIFLYKCKTVYFYPVFQKQTFVQKSSQPPPQLLNGLSLTLLFLSLKRTYIDMLQGCVEYKSCAKFTHCKVQAVCPWWNHFSLTFNSSPYSLLFLLVHILIRDCNFSYLSQTPIPPLPLLPLFIFQSSNIWRAKFFLFTMWQFTMQLIGYCYN